MEDTPANDPPGEDLNTLDLSALKSFEFGTEWTPATDPKKIPQDRPGRGRGRAPGHGKPGGGGPRRDRRPQRPDRRDSGGGQGPRGGFDRDRGQGPQRANQGPGDRRDQGHHPRGGGRYPRDRGGRGPHHGPPQPYVSPYFDVTFYPDDVVFEALVKGMRASCRTYELFEIARLILEKPERCVVVVKARPGQDGAAGSLFVSVPDGVPFPTEDEAINHVMENHLGSFFSTEQIETEPPKGAFNFVNKCPVTGTLLGPPNYHRYAQILQQHYASHNIRMPLERYKASIEVVKDPEAVAQWLESMKTVTRYTFLVETDGEKKTFDSLEDARVHLLHACRDRIVKAAESTRVQAKNIVSAERSEARRAMRGVVEMQRRFPLDTANALRGRLRRENFHLFKRGSKGVTYVCSVRRKFRQPGQVFSGTVGKMLELIDSSPLIQVSNLAENLLGFAPPHAPHPAAAKPETLPKEAEKTAGEAPAKQVAEPVTEPASQADADTSSGAEASAEAPEEVAKAEVSPDADSKSEVEKPAEPKAAETSKEAPVGEELTEEQKSQLNRLALDLRWLVTEGYVAEFSDGRLFAHPVMEPEGPGKKAKAAKIKEAAEAEARAAPEVSAAPAAAETAVEEPARPTPEPEGTAVAVASEQTAAEATPTSEPDDAKPAEPKVEETADTAPAEPESPAEEPEAEVPAKAASAGESPAGTEPAATKEDEGNPSEPDGASRS